MLTGTWGGLAAHDTRPRSHKMRHAPEYLKSSNFLPSRNPHGANRHREKPASSPAGRLPSNRRGRAAGVPARTRSWARGGDTQMLIRLGRCPGQLERKPQGCPQGPQRCCSGTAQRKNPGTFDPVLQFFQNQPLTPASFSPRPVPAGTPQRAPRRGQRDAPSWSSNRTPSSGRMSSRRASLSCRTSGTVDGDCGSVQPDTQAAPGRAYRAPSCGLWGSRGPGSEDAADWAAPRDPALRQIPSAAVPARLRGIQSRKPGGQQVQGNEVSPPEKELRSPQAPGQPGRCPSPTAPARRSREAAASHTPDAGTRGHARSEVTQKPRKGSLCSSRPDRPARCRETPGVDERAGTSVPTGPNLQQRPTLPQPPPCEPHPCFLQTSSRPGS